MRLEPRDQMILSVINKYGVLSSTQIAEWFFPNVAKTTALRRIRHLVKGKYLEACVPLDDGSRTFCLGKKGRESLSQNERYSFSNRNTITHEVTISAIRWKLESFNLAKDVTSGFILKSEGFRNQRYHQAKEQLIPDALMVEIIRGSARAMALEIELTVKSEKRYRRIFADYWGKDSLKHVWYFVNTWKEASRLLNIAERYYPAFAGRLWFSTVSEFLSEEMPRVFISHEKRFFKLNEIAFTEFKIPEKPAQGPAQGVSTLNDVNSQTENTANTAKSGANLFSLDAARGGSLVPDHSPSTSGSGQGRGTGEESKENKLEESVGVKKCG
ncbi:MAG: replication-relaxation family protein [Pseudobdellovibrionaceae bacterium]